MLHYIFFVVLFLLLLIFVVHKLHLRKVAHIPGYTQVFPRIIIPIPFINPYGFGNFKRFPEIDNEWREKNPQFKDELVTRVTFFFRTLIIVKDANIVKDVMLNRSREFPKPEEQYEFLFGFFGPNILTSTGDVWKKHHNLCNPAFSDKNLQHLIKCSREKTLNEFKRLETGNPVDVSTRMCNITLNIIGSAGFGVDLEEEKMSKFNQVIKSTIEEKKFMYRVLVPPFIQNLLLVAPFDNLYKQVNRDNEYFGNKLNEIIEEREKSKEDKYDLLTLMMQSRDGNEILTKREITSDSFIFLLAGHDTTASQLSSTLYVLSNRPEIQEKIYEEVKHIDENSTMDDYNNLKYTNNVVNESLRLYPPVMAVSKTNSKDLELNGHKIPQGSTIVIDFDYLHHDQKYWKDPYEFKPERFNEHITTGSYLPFSLGPRKCIGLRFSLTESLVIIANLIKNYKILPGDKDYKYKRTIGIVSKPIGLNLIFEKRK